MQLASLLELEPTEFYLQRARGYKTELTEWDNSLESEKVDDGAILKI
jgi:hypothetical protein